MPDPSIAISDRSRGVYRRIYGNFIWGKRINSVSLGAEAWFWRVNGTADDFGNLDADPAVIYTRTVGRRVASVTVEHVVGFVAELTAARLLAEYEVGGERYLHVVDFEDFQPAAKNGKRVRRVPASPWDGGGNGTAIADGADAAGVSGGIQGNPDLPGGVQVNPGAASASHSHSHSHSQKEDKPAAPASAEPAMRASPAPVDDSPVVLAFDCVGGRRNKSMTWMLTEAYVSELKASFTGVDVAAECRKALGWLRANPGHRKTADGMKSFLWRWIKREQNAGSGKFGSFNSNGKHASVKRHCGTDENLRFE